MDTLSENTKNPEGQIRSAGSSDLKKSTSVPVSELADTMARITLADVSNGTAGDRALHQDTDISSGPPPLDRPCQLVKEFLLNTSPEFVRVTQLRDRVKFPSTRPLRLFFKGLTSEIGLV